VIRYRLRQLLRALTGRVSAVERAWIAARLNPAELCLFTRMAGFDQRHCLDVAQVLSRSGQREPALLRAALLHDCGKVGDDGVPIPLLYYGVFVVLRRFAPPLYRQGVRHAHGPLRHFAVHAAHEQRALMLCRAAGSEAATLTILHDYATRHRTTQTAWLRWADDQV
jgi:hypothetical protein